MQRRLTPLLALVFLAAGCGATVTPSAPAPTGSVATHLATPAAASSAAATLNPHATFDRVAGWQSDIAALVPGMARLHKDLYHGVSEEALTDAAAQLAATTSTATDDELLDGIMRIVAMVSAGGCDAHTGAYVWGLGHYPLESLPLRLWLFGEDVVVVAALPPYADLVGQRITSMEGHPTADVIAALDPLVPRDNAETVRLLLPRFLLIPQILRGVGRADGGPISLAVDRGEGTNASPVEIVPIPMTDYNAWAGPYGLHLPANPDVLYLSRIDDALWWQLLDDHETLYVQYNRVDLLPTQTFTDLGNALADPAVTRVVLDLRHNYGGELRALNPMEALFQNPAYDEPGRLIVATGRNTFSAGSLLVARLQRDTAAEILGEPMGGCPTFWSDPAPLDLPWSGIEVDVSDDFAVGVDPADTRHGILPDVPIELTLDNWRDGFDPVVDSLVAHGP